jgi:hypothetical protein
MASPTTQTANAIRAITNKHSIPVPEIDFTQHTLENGETVSTTERVVKDVSRALCAGRIPPPPHTSPHPTPWRVVEPS